ncbi:MAG: GLUG motif-containing protein [Rhizomicrobium sp.]
MTKFQARASLNSTASIAAMAIAFAATAHAGGLPTHGHYVSGQGSIAKANQSLTVKQSSTTGIIDWNSFSVGAKHGVTFDNGTGATLNRVTGGNLSTIAGSLHATGSLYLMNNAGAIVTGTGHVLTGGNFVATSGNFTGTAFGDGDRRFTDAKAAIVNHGSIRAGGNVGLIGDSVTNTGKIAAASVQLHAQDGDATALGTIRAEGTATHAPRIVVISDTGKTRIDGHLVAQRRDGSGGFIETSGTALSIHGRVDAGDGGHWTVDPTNLKVTKSAAKTIDKSLNLGTNVTLQTTASGASGPGTTSTGDGNITIAAPLAWSTSAQLTLDSYASILVDDAIDVTGAGRVSLSTGSGGNLLFTGGNLAFAGAGGALAIDGQAYTLVDNLATLARDIAHNADGNFALAGNYNAAADGVYDASPITTKFYGSFEGLGNTISNLTIDAPDRKFVGLFSDTGANALVANVNLANENVTGGGGDTGGLIGISHGVALQDSTSGAIEVSAYGYAGGLVGSLRGGAWVDASHSSASVSDSHKRGRLGGLVGQAQQDSEIQASYATGNVSGGAESYVGGVLGEGKNAKIGESYATGTVSDSANGNVGGLAGAMRGGVIQASYATGSVSGMDDAWVGGLVGLNTGKVANSYATGSATGGAGAEVGGLAGRTAGLIEDSYSTGSVTGGSQSYIGGLIGFDNSGGNIENAYWDTTTSGIANAADGAGNVTNDSGITGLTTAQLRASLPAGFSSSYWSQSASVNGGLPYLTSLAGSY